ncbi:MAG: fluoride efflux transporter CrcB [Gemmatimonadota bacterium]
MGPSAFSPALLAAVALGSAIGGVARYVMTFLVQPRDVAFPLGTLAVNILGCFLIGAIAQYSLAPGRLSPELRVLLMSGFCGGFTTFSTFSFESVELIQAGAWSRALLYTFISVTVGLAAVSAGALTVRAATGAAA